MSKALAETQRAIGEQQPGGAAGAGAGEGAGAGGEDLAGLVNNCVKQRKANKVRKGRLGRARTAASFCGTQPHGSWCMCHEGAASQALGCWPDHWSERVVE